MNIHIGIMIHVDVNFYYVLGNPNLTIKTGRFSLLTTLGIVMLINNTQRHNSLCARNTRMNNALDYCMYEVKDSTAGSGRGGGWGGGAERTEHFES